MSENAYLINQETSIHSHLPAGAKSHGKVIQIETNKFNEKFVVFALKDDGSIWTCETKDNQWQQWKKFTGP